MAKILIVGSGASGVHFALSVLNKGYEVTMIDVGKQGPASVYPHHSLNELKMSLEDPTAYFLGENFEALVLPDGEREYYGFPPNKNYVVDPIPANRVRTSGFAPLSSFAQGGLGQVWTGGVYPFNDHELTEFPFGYEDIAPFYSEVARRIGVSGVKDDLSRFLPIHDNLLAPLDLDEHSAMLLSDYESHKESLNHKLRWYLGRSRIATLREDKEDREKCSYLGRCLWSCPSQALYTPSVTLQECKRYANFRYVPDLYVRYFKYNAKRRITAVVATSVKCDSEYEFRVDNLVLAAGTLSSSRIFMESIYRNTGEIVKLTGLMDNRQILIPFVNLKMIGRTFNPDTYQYHQIAFGLESETPQKYVHGQITTLKTALVHPIIQSFPLDLRSSIFIFRHIHAALGIVNLNFNDDRRPENIVTLDADRNSLEPTLVIQYVPTVNEPKRLDDAVRRVKKALWKLACVVPPGMMHVRPMGASVHYAGTLPMSAKPGIFTTSKMCQSHDFDNLYVVDGATFPFLPAKNITLTLMANAIRVAECAF